MQRVPRRHAGVGVAGADKAHRANGVGFEVFAEPLIEREEGRLHGLHEEPVVAACGGQNLGELQFIQGGGLFTKHVLARSESLDADFSVGIGVGGDVDCVHIAGGEVFH